MNGWSSYPKAKLTHPPSICRGWPRTWRTWSARSRIWALSGRTIRSTRSPNAKNRWTYLCSLKWTVAEIFRPLARIRRIWSLRRRSSTSLTSIRNLMGWKPSSPKITARGRSSTSYRWGRWTRSTALRKDRPQKHRSHDSSTRTASTKNYSSTTLEIGTRQATFPAKSNPRFPRATTTPPASKTPRPWARAAANPQCARQNEPLSCFNLIFFHKYHP